MKNPLIECADGHLAPAVLICRHIMDDTAKTWVRFPMLDGEETSDCLCKKCFRKGAVGLLPGHDLRSCCMICFNKMAEAPSGPAGGRGQP
jgi:hypothetical protein